MGNKTNKRKLEKPMNDIRRIYKETNTAGAFALEYLNHLTRIMKQIDINAVTDFIHELEMARNQGHTVFVVGNGGSAATASHMANDIGLDVMKKSDTNIPFRILSLTDNIPVISAIGNDNGYENIFLYQLRILYRPGDKLIAISASGNSPNVIRAVEYVKSQNGIVLGLTGFDGGKLADMCDIAIHIKTKPGEYGPVEDIHMIMDHLIASYLQYKVEEDVLTDNFVLATCMNKEAACE